MSCKGTGSMKIADKQYKNDPNLDKYGMYCITLGRNMLLLSKSQRLSTQVSQRGINKPSNPAAHCILDKS